MYRFYSIVKTKLFCLKFIRLNIELSKSNDIANGNNYLLVLTTRFWKLVTLVKMSTNILNITKHRALSNNFRKID